MKILFLDINGVLNNKTRWTGPYAENLDQENINHLKSIVDATDCKIVVHSSWRYNKHKNFYIGMTIRLQDAGIDSIIGHTRVDLIGEESLIRSQGIEDWLWLNQDLGIERVAILDDWKLNILVKNGKFFQINAKYGLTKELAVDVIRHLNDQNEGDRGNEVLPNTSVREDNSNAEGSSTEVATKD